MKHKVAHLNQQLQIKPIYNDLFMTPSNTEISAKPPYFIDLFAGCGGLSLGLEQAGFTPIFVNELNKDAMETYLMNRDDEFPWLRNNKIHDVKELVGNPHIIDELKLKFISQFGIDVSNGDLDLLVGGPPCQGFSGIGHRRSYSVDKAELPSNHLYQDMAYAIKQFQPKIFLFENVKGLLTAKWTKEGVKGEIFQDVFQTFDSIPNYSVFWKLIHAKNYGVPQNRPRVLIVGLRNDYFPKFKRSGGDPVLLGCLPAPSYGAPDIAELLSDLSYPHYNNGGTDTTYFSPASTAIQKKLRTHKRTGKHLKQGSPLSEQEYSNHKDSIIAKFKAMQMNKGVIPDEYKTKKFSQKLLPRHWGTSGPTMTVCSMPDDYVHYELPRVLTVREWARLQTFPDWYQFAGKRTTGGIRRAGNPREGIFDRELPKFTQIGNAVPVALGEALGKHFMQLLTLQP